MEKLPDKFLLFRSQVRFVAVEAVVFRSAEMSDEAFLHFLRRLVRNVVEQMPDAPCYTYFLRRFEKEAMCGIGRNTHGIYNIDERIVGGIVACDDATQTVGSFRTLAVEAARKIVWRRQVVGLCFHNHYIVFTGLNRDVRSFVSLRSRLRFAKIM